MNNSIVNAEDYIVNAEDYYDELPLLRELKIKDRIMQEVEDYTTDPVAIEGMKKALARMLRMTVD